MSRNREYKMCVSQFAELGSMSLVEAHLSQLHKSCEMYGWNKSRLLRDIWRVIREDDISITSTVEKLNNKYNAGYTEISTAIEKYFIPPLESKCMSIYGEVTKNIKAMGVKAIGQYSTLFFSKKPKNIMQMKKIFYRQYSIEESVNKSVEYLMDFHEEEGITLTPKERKAIKEQRKKNLRNYIDYHIVVKFFIGLMMQDLVSKVLSEKFDLEWFYGTEEDDAHQIDGYLGDIPISIKTSSANNGKRFGKEREVLDVLYTLKKSGEVFLDFEEVYCCLQEEDLIDMKGKNNV